MRSTMVTTGHSLASLVPIEPNHVAGVQALLKDLPIDYPDGDKWLKRRLADAIHGEAECWIAMVQDQTVGVVILTPKPRSLKLSTIYVEDRFRGLGLGSLLMERTILSSNVRGLDETYVTVAHQKVPLLHRLLGSHGFTRVAVEQDRYGIGRHEVIYSRIGS